MASTAGKTKNAITPSSRRLDCRIAQCLEELEALRFHTKMETLRNRLEMAELTGRYEAAKRALGYAQESMEEDFSHFEGWYRHAFHKASKEERKPSLMRDPSGLEIEVCGLVHRTRVTESQIKIVKQEICDLVTASKELEQNLKEERMLCSRHYQSLMLKAVKKKQKAKDKYEQKITRHEAKIRGLHLLLAAKGGRSIPRFGSDTANHHTKAVVVVDEHHTPSILPLRTLQAARTA